MRQLLLLVSVLLLGLSWAVAQDNTSSSPSSSSTSSAQSADSSAASGQTSRPSAGGQMTVEGCLSGSNGNFTLTDKNGMSYQLTGDAAKTERARRPRNKGYGHIGISHRRGEFHWRIKRGSIRANASSHLHEAHFQNVQIWRWRHVTLTCGKWLRRKPSRCAGLSLFADIAKA